LVAGLREGGRDGGTEGGIDVKGRRGEVRRKGGRQGWKENIPWTQPPRCACVRRGEEGGR